MVEFLQIFGMVFGGLMVVLILLQQRGASLGAGLSASGELHTERRGLEKSIFIATVVCAVLFVGSIFLGLVLA